MKQTKIKEEWEKKFAQAVGARVKFNNNATQSTFGAKEMREINTELWNWIEQTHKQDMEEMIEKIVDLSSKYWIDKPVGYGTPLIVNKTQFKRFVLEELKEINNEK